MSPRPVTTELMVQLLVQAVRAGVETVRDMQVDGAQCDANADYRRGWIGACDQLLGELTKEA